VKIYKSNILSLKKLYVVMASDVKAVVGKNAKDAILSFSAIGCRIKATHGSFVTALHYEIQL